MAMFAVFLIITPTKHGWDIIWGLFQSSFASGKWMGGGGWKASWEIYPWLHTATGQPSASYQDYIVVASK